MMLGKNVGRHDTQHNEIYYNDTQHIGIICDILNLHVCSTFGAMTLSITTFIITTLYHYAECNILFIVMLNVIMLSVIMLSFVAPNVEHTFIFRILQNNPIPIC